LIPNWKASGDFKKKNKRRGKRGTTEEDALCKELGEDSLNCWGRNPKRPAPGKPMPKRKKEIKSLKVSTRKKETGPRKGKRNALGLEGG